MSHYDGLQLVPPALVGVARALFVSQGLSAAAVSDAGEIDAAAFIPLAFDTVEVQTRLGPPVKFRLDGQPTQGDDLLKTVQPALIFTGRAGRAEIAPYGFPNTIIGAITTAGPLIGFGIGAGLLGIMLMGAAVLRR
jgi:hypothetical protein